MPDDFSKASSTTPKYGNHNAAWIGLKDDPAFTAQERSAVMSNTQWARRKLDWSASDAGLVAHRMRDIQWHRVCGMLREKFGTDKRIQTMEGITHAARRVC